MAWEYNDLCNEDMITVATAAGVSSLVRHAYKKKMYLSVQARVAINKMNYTEEQIETMIGRTIQESRQLRADRFEFTPNTLVHSQISKYRLAFIAQHDLTDILLT